MNIIRELQIHFKDKIKSIDERSRKRIYLDIDKQDLPSFTKLITKVLGARFITATGIHIPNDFVILYHFSFDEMNKIVTARVFLGKDAPEVDTISTILKAGEWIEREMCELIGINFKGHQNLKRLLLDDDWPQGDYPLRHEKK